MLYGQFVHAVLALIIRLTFSTVKEDVVPAAAAAVDRRVAAERLLSTGSAQRGEHKKSGEPTSVDFATLQNTG